MQYMFSIDRLDLHLSLAHNTTASFAVIFDCLPRSLQFEHVLIPSGK